MKHSEFIQILYEIARNTDRVKNDSARSMDERIEATHIGAVAKQILARKLPPRWEQYTDERQPQEVAQ